MKGIRAVVFDMDGTLIEENSWQVLNLALGVSKDVEDKLYWEYHEEHKFTYQEWIDQALAIYFAAGPVHRSKVEEILLGYALREGAEETVRGLQDRSLRVGLVSGGIETVAIAVAEEVGINREFTLANSSFRYDSKDNLHSVVVQGDDYEVKIRHLQALCGVWQIGLEECLCVGDSYADLPLFEATGNGVTFDFPRCHMLHGPRWKKISALPELLNFL